jgi:putative intracellular protease/amidase
VLGTLTCSGAGDQESLLKTYRIAEVEMSQHSYRGRAGGVLSFVGHFLQMVVAMVIGMLVLGPLWGVALPGLSGRADLQALVMATNMSIGMAVWMRVRRHGWPSTAEMIAAMYVPFVVLLVPYWAGVISGSVLMTVGHLLMLPAMVAAMLRRRDEYTRAHHHGASPRRRRWARVLVRIGVVAIAVAVPPAVVGAVSASAYLDSLYEPAMDTAMPASVRDTKPRSHDPAKPTAVVLVGNHGANVGDALAPYETLAATGAFNLYTVAPNRRRVPLTGGLDLVPDLSFVELDRRLGGRAADVIAIPQLPDPAGAPSQPLRVWLNQQAAGGALLLGVCIGSEVLAAAGLLDGRDATSHWFRLGALEERHPQVRWHRATRYVDDGNVITTGGVLSGIDGALRVIERRLGTRAAATAAAAVGWKNYSPGTPAPLPPSSFGPRDMIVGVNLSFRSHPNIGVLLTDGIGEIELASVFGTYTEAAYAARTFAVGVGSRAPVRSRHGLVFVPRGDAFTASNLDRLVVPGVDAARRHDPALNTLAGAALGLSPEYVHTEPGFAFDAALRDIARTIDVPTARWRAKTLEYPAADLELTGPGWPLGVTLTPLLYSLMGLAGAGAVWLALRARRAARLAPPPGLGLVARSGVRRVGAGGGSGLLVAIQNRLR